MIAKANRDMTTYHKTVPFAGEAGKAIELIQNLCLQSGFRIESASPDRIMARQANHLTRIKAAGSLYGVSPLEVTVSDGRLTVNAGFEGIHMLKRFLLWMLVGLGLLLGLILGITFAVVFEDQWPMWLGLGLGAGIPLIQLPLHLLLTPRIMKRRAIQGLDTMVHSVIILCGSSH